MRSGCHGVGADCLEGKSGEVISEWTIGDRLEGLWRKTTLADSVVQEVDSRAPNRSSNYGDRLRSFLRAEKAPQILKAGLNF